jgi:hypothetical protein
LALGFGQRTATEGRSLGGGEFSYIGQMFTQYLPVLLAGVARGMCVELVHCEPSYPFRFYATRCVYKYSLVTILTTRDMSWLIMSVATRVKDKRNLRNHDYASMNFHNKFVVYL